MPHSVVCGIRVWPLVGEQDPELCSRLAVLCAGIIVLILTWSMVLSALVICFDPSSGLGARASRGGMTLSSTVRMPVMDSTIAGTEH